MNSQTNFPLNLPITFDSSSSFNSHSNLASPIAKIKTYSSSFTYQDSEINKNSFMSHPSNNIDSFMINQSSQSNLHPLHSKVDRVLALNFSNNDAQTGLSLLPQFGDYNSSEFRTNLPHNINLEKIKVVEHVLNSAKPIYSFLQTLMDSLETIQDTLDNTLVNLKENNNELNKVLQDMFELQAQREEIVEKRQACNNFISYFKLSEENFKILTDPERPIDKLYFDSFSKLQTIRKRALEWKELSPNTNAFVAKEILYKTEELLELAFGQIFTFVQQKLSSSEPFWKDKLDIFPDILDEQNNSNNNDTDEITKKYIDSNVTDKNQASMNSFFDVNLKKINSGNNDSLKENSDFIKPDTRENFLDAPLNDLFKHLYSSKSPFYQILSLLKHHKRYFFLILQEISNSRRINILKDFQNVLYHGDESSQFVPLDLHIYDHLRFISDILTWVYQRSISEQSTLELLSPFLSNLSLPVLPYQNLQNNYRNLSPQNDILNSVLNDSHIKVSSSSSSSSSSIPYSSTFDLNSGLLIETENPYLKKHKQSTRLNSSSKMSVKNKNESIMLEEENVEPSPSYKTNEHPVQSNSSISLNTVSDPSKIILNNFEHDKNTNRSVFGDLDYSTIHDNTEIAYLTNSYSNSPDELFPLFEIWMNITQNKVPQTIANALLDCILNGLSDPFTNSIEQLLRSNPSISILYTILHWVNRFIDLLYSIFPFYSSPIENNKKDKKVSSFIFDSSLLIESPKLNSKKDSKSYDESAVINNKYNDFSLDLGINNNENKVPPKLNIFSSFNKDKFLFNSKNKNINQNLSTQQEYKLQDPTNYSYYLNNNSTKDDNKEPFYQPLFIRCLISIEESIHMHIDDALHNRAIKISSLHHSTYFNADLSPPQIVRETRTLIIDILDSYEASNLPQQRKGKDIEHIIDRIIYPTLQFCKQMAHPLPLGDCHVFLINSFALIYTVFENHNYIENRLEVYNSLVKEQLDLLVEFEVDRFLDKSGFSHRLTLLKETEDVDNLLESNAFFHPMSLLDAFTSFYNQLGSHFNSQIPSINKIRPTNLRLNAREKLNYRLADSYERIYEIAKPFLLNIHEPSIIRTLLGI